VVHSTECRSIPGNFPIVLSRHSLDESSTHVKHQVHSDAALLVEAKRREFVNAVAPREKPAGIEAKRVRRCGILACSHMQTRTRSDPIRKPSNMMSRGSGGAVIRSG
jgi:hypothetical protein